MPESKKIPTLKAAALVNPEEQATPGTLREGPRRIFVAGARRRVAIHLIERLLAAPEVDLVLGVDRGPCPPALLGCDPERFIFATADLSKRRQVDNLFLLDRLRERPLDSVVHLAFQGNPRGYGVESHEFNVNAARHLLEASLRHGVAKYLFLSSDAVYKIGPRTDYKVREDGELNLDPDVHPILRDTIDAEFMCPIVASRIKGTKGLRLVELRVHPNAGTVSCRLVSVSGVSSQSTENAVATGAADTTLSLTLPLSLEGGSFLVRCTLPPGARIRSYLVVE